MSNIAPNRIVKIEGKEISEDISGDIISVRVAISTSLAWSS